MSVFITAAAIGKLGVSSANTPKYLPYNSDRPPDVCYDESFATVYNILPFAYPEYPVVYIERYSPVKSSCLVSYPNPIAFNIAYANVVLPSEPVPYDVNIYYAADVLSNNLTNI